jgi:glycosyltransferase involved in cell wall biosynthesis
MGFEGRKPIRVLFDERVIPNYRVGVFRKFAALPDIDLAVSYWKERNAEEPPQSEADGGFGRVEFTPIRFRMFGRSVWINVDLLRYVLSRKPNVVIGRFGLFGVNSFASFLIERFCSITVGTRFIYRVSGPLPEGRNLLGRSFRNFSRWLIYRKAVVCTYGERAAQAVIRQGCDPKRVFVDFNTMDTDELFSIRKSLEENAAPWKEDFLRTYRIREEGFVLFASRILPGKRLDLLIEAWKRVVVRVPDVQLVVVGSGSAKEQAMKLVEGLGDRVVFHEGIYDTRELAKFYSLCSMIVFPGYATIATSFAMCFAKPMVSSQYGNEVEYVRDGINGFIYQYGNVEQLAEKLVTLLKDYTLRERFGSAAERLAIDQVNAEHLVSTIGRAVRFAAIE